ncbi:MAG: 2-isopropylmalate synthase, partial [Nitrospirae bacterium]|nr:2-isopropylmalate synthase [Nitrospirota bacterium]
SKTDHVYGLVSLVGTFGTEGKPLARITISKLGQELKTESTGDGPVDAAYNAIAQLTQTKSQLLKYEVKSITGGTDAQAEVFVTLEEEGRTVRGAGSHTDTIVASAKAYIDAINKLEGKQRVIEPGV